MSVTCSAALYALRLETGCNKAMFLVKLELPHPHSLTFTINFKDRVSLHISLTDCPHALRMYPSTCLENL